MSDIDSPTPTARFWECRSRLADSSCIAEWKHGCASAVLYLHKTGNTDSLKLDDLDLFTEQSDEGLYETVLDRVFTEEQWEAHCEGLRDREGSWPLLNVAVVAGNAQSMTAGEQTLSRLLNHYTALLSGNCSGIRIANAIVRDKQLAKPLEDGCVLHICFAGRF